MDIKTNNSLESDLLKKNRDFGKRILKARLKGHDIFIKTDGYVHILGEVSDTDEMMKVIMDSQKGQTT